MQLSEMQSSRGQASTSTSTTAMSSQSYSRHAELAVQRVINRTLLPDVISRQAAETKRLIRYIDDQVKHTAKSQDIDALRRTIASLRAQLGTAEGDTALGSEAPAKGAVSEAAGVGSSSPVPEPTPSATAWSEEVQQLQEQQIVALGIRLEQVEAALADANTRIATSGGARAAAGGEAADGTSSRGLSRSVEDAMEGKVSDLKVMVSRVDSQLPLMARIYEVEALKRALDELRDQLRVVNQQGSKQVQVTLSGSGDDAPAALEALREHMSQQSEQLAQAHHKLVALGDAVALADERSKALLTQMSEVEPRWGVALAEIKQALPL